MADLLTPWLTGQRWYAAKGTELVELRRVGGLRLNGADEVGIEMHIVRARTADGGTSAYQVPLTYRPQPAPHLADALVGIFSHPSLGVRYVYDAPHDPVFVAALLELLDGGRAASVDDTEDRAVGGAVGVMQRPEPPTPAPAKVLTGEQSNTSIIVGAQGVDPMIIKLFRVLQPGVNPDVVVQTRLATAGCERVPRPVGWIQGTWSEEPAGSLVEGHLAYACEFVADGEDAWRLACRAVQSGAPFLDEAYDLGRATAEVHSVLAGALPTVPADGAVLDRLADGLTRRVHWAVGLVPALGPYAAAALAAVDAVRELADPPALQQIHGDYHLGQVLHSPTRGWVLLDFEGEPLRPLAERLEPDLALRDVAGMLRSFDYAAGHATVNLAGDDSRVAAAQKWSHQARGAFLAGYRAEGGRIDGEPDSPDAGLLRALEIGKAVYEVVYETLNRPDWVSIPLAALRRLTALA
jgi:1,4-alpha-glucan branching enzyme